MTGRWGHLTQTKPGWAVWGLSTVEGIWGPSWLAGGWSHPPPRPRTPQPSSAQPMVPTRAPWSWQSEPLWSAEPSTLFSLLTRVYAICQASLPALVGAGLKVLTGPVLKPPRLPHAWLDARISEPPRAHRNAHSKLRPRYPGSTQAPVGPRSLHFYKLMLVPREIRESLLPGRQARPVMAQCGQC